MKKDIKIYPICIEGDPILKMVCIEIAKDHVGLEHIIERMHATLDATETGVGMAAPQVGLSIKMFILGGVDRPKKTFINPEILVMKGSKPKNREGCLSVPKVFATVERFQKVRMKYFDENFVEHTKLFKGFEAMVIQHEFDHIMGIEFHERLSKHEYAKIKKQLENLKRGDIPKVNYLIKLYGKKENLLSK